MPAALLRRLLLCLAVASPALVLRITGLAPHPVLDLVVFGAAVVAASFVLAWAAEAAQKDISGALAIAILALIAVLPEYAVDLYYAFRSGSDPAYEQFAAANMTGSNRLLLGLGWPLVALVALGAARRAAGASRGGGNSRGGGASRGGAGIGRGPAFLQLPAASRLDLGFLAILAVVAFAIPLMGRIPVWFGIALIAVFIAYLWRAGQAPDDGEEEFVGAAALIVELPHRSRRATVIGLFVASAAVILASAEPFADALVASGTSLGIDSYVLVQWLAPLASEAPEFIIAILFALRGLGAAAITTLIASKINQWSLLVGSLPLAHLAGGGGTDLGLDARQVEEFVLTATQTVMGVAILLALRFHRASAIALLTLFALQFAVTGTEGRYILSAVQVVVAAWFLGAHRHEILPTLGAPFRRPAADADSAPQDRVPAPIA
ncbi:sodium:proton exchanger [Brachybacterium phenoliresistens]|uniref:sodium:proton exchanger n=1 Tax=Brachybacterium phenoliresistens TaxID=396014 RepID=UPI0031D9131C